jgi:hypothetical protein
MRHLLALCYNMQHPGGEAKLQGKTGRECLMNPTIASQLFLFRQFSRRRIFERPEAMPTGTGNDWSGVYHPTTKDDALIPPQAKRWLNEACWSNEGNRLLLQDMLNQSVFLSILGRRAPDLKVVSNHRLEETGSQQGTTRSACTEKKDT